MSSHRTEISSFGLLLTAAVWAGLTGCRSDATPTEATVGEAAVNAVAATFGPFPAGTTVFVDVDNTTGVENGSRDHPFNTLSEGIAAARSGDAVGLAPGVYAETFASLSPNFVIKGLKDFKLLGSGAANTTIRGDHSNSLIRVEDGASALIKGVTIERGGHINHSEGGGIQVLAHQAPVTLTLQSVIFWDNEAVNGGGISAEGTVALRLVNVVVANNRAQNGCGGVYLLGANGDVKATIRNSTITANAASFLAGGVCVSNESRLDLVNSIVWNNSLAELVETHPGGERLSVSYSDVGESSFPGPGNISVFPKFVDPANRDYRLRARSPAVDAGTNTAAPRTDLRGVARPVDGDGDGTAVTDIGAFEFGKIF